MVPIADSRPIATVAFTPVMVSSLRNRSSPILACAKA
jgi:hypothetical protein